MIFRSHRLHESSDSVNPDVLEVSDKLTLLAAARWARERGIRCTLLSHERIDAILRGRLPKFVPLHRAADAWETRAVEIFDVVICRSASVCHEFERIGATNATVVPWGVDLETFSPGTRRGEVAGRSVVELICVGRLSKEKEPALAVDVAAERRRGLDVHLTMVGAGPMMDWLKRRAQGYPVSFADHIHDRGEIVHLLASADVTLAPCRAETLPAWPSWSRWRAGHQS